jgi:hypothetical protein
MEVSNRSFNLFDLEHLVAVAKQAENFVNNTGARSFEVLVYDENHDYILGKLWLDPETQAIRFDPADYGKD